MALTGGDEAYDVSPEDFISVIDEENVSGIINSQEAMISKLEKTNAMLHTVCELSTDRLGPISAQLRASTKTLIALKNELSAVLAKWESELDADSVDNPPPTEEPSPGQMGFYVLSILRDIALGFVEDLSACVQTILWIKNELGKLLRTTRQAWHILFTLIVLTLGLIALKVVCYQSSSLALFAFSELILFDVLALVVALVSFWVRQQSANVNTYCFGYDRFEVIAVFASTILAILSSFYLLKEAIECLFEPATTDFPFPFSPQVETEYMPFTAVFTLLLHSLGIYAVDNPAFSHVTQASVSNWLQEHTSDISRSVCGTVPGLSRILLPRLNPISLVGWLISMVVLCAYVFMSTGQTDSFPDTIAAVTISLLLFSTMVPMAAYCPVSAVSQIVHLLLALLLVDHAVSWYFAKRSPPTATEQKLKSVGVLELRNEHFWTVGFGTLIGSLYVRVRRDADEQLVLAHVTNRLHPLVKHLTIQVIKDDWTRPTASARFDWPQLPVSPTSQPPQQMPSAALQHNHSHSHTVYPSNMMHH
ncbi:unnamed protein product [Dibothriocephalus latus]|uniref:Uncharacterized protein n=1 Tax=Dibothriocephalus latus TaxID=60516 RepID=A0A3P6U4U8_DIBLA|nr:unnamed protein product [Dibothriocephalus latus]